MEWSGGGDRSTVGSGAAGQFIGIDGDGAIDRIDIIFVQIHGFQGGEKMLDVEPDMFVFDVQSGVHFADSPAGIDRRSAQGGAEELDLHALELVGFDSFEQRGENGIGKDAGIERGDEFLYSVFSSRPFKEIVFAHDGKP